MDKTLGRHLVALAAALVCSGAHAQGRDPEPADLSLEELLRSEVVTVSRKPQSLQATAAAAFIITREDIERSGASSVPEALRLAPGVQVARIANNRWAVSVRGFNGRFANKLLVLMDGRSIYSPLFSGVMWEFEDTLLEDIERIEVIRGPGAALWGANAVNGVINIITRKARETQGELAVLTGGSSERGMAAFRHGMPSADGHLRLWGKAFARDQSITPDNAPGKDQWRSLRAGFRGDWPLAGGHRLTLSGSAYNTATPDRWNLPDLGAATGFTASDVGQAGLGVHLLARQEWLLADASEAALQLTLDHQDIDLPGYIHQVRTTLDADFQRRMRGGERHDIVWGLGLRYSPDRIDTSSIAQITPRKRSARLASAYVHDEIELGPQLRLTLGLRLEHNSATGFEPQPNARLLWLPTPSQSVWATLSRAVRTPSRAEADAVVDLAVTPAAPPVPAVLIRSSGGGVGALDAERVNTVELGYRQQVDSRLSFDAAAFASDFSGIRSARFDSTEVLLYQGRMPYVLQKISTGNGINVRSRGVELSAEWLATPWWRIQPNVSWISMAGRAVDADPLLVADAAGYATSTPRYQWSVRSAMSLEGRKQLDLWLRHVARIGDATSGLSPIPAYTTMDLRLAWRINPGLELSVVGQNLLARRHAEAATELLPSQLRLVERSVYAKARWQF